MLNINFWNIAFTIINVVVLYSVFKAFPYEAADVHSGKEETDGGKEIR